MKDDNDNATQTKHGIKPYMILNPQKVLRQLLLNERINYFMGIRRFVWQENVQI